jgi:NADH-quinone oxidoreductase subunit M
MLSHGLTTGGLFLGIGVLYERRHTRRLAEYGGIWKQMPVFSGLFLIVVMGSAGLPALSGFIGEFLTLFGTFVSYESFPAGYLLPHPKVLAALSATGVILGAIYLLYMFQKVFFGKLDKAKNGKLPDLRGHELFVFIILAITILVGGLFPKVPLNVMEPSVQKFTRDFARRVNEPDGPPHVYGSLPAAAPEGSAPVGTPPTGTPPTGAPPTPTGAPPTGAPPTGAPPTGAPPPGNTPPGRAAAAPNGGTP